MQRRVVISVILVVVLLGAGAGSMHLLVLTKPTPHAREPENRPLVVHAVQVQPRSVTEPIVGYGTARAERYAWLSAQVSGEVVELAGDLKIGAEVAAGQLLVRIDDREYGEQLKRAESLLAADEARLAALDVEQRNLDRLIEIAAQELEIARREYDRVRNLLEQQVAGERELDLARSAYEAARRILLTQENAQALLPQRRAQQEAACAQRRAEVALAQLNVERCRIVAPFGGRIEALEVELGEQAAPGGRLLALLEPDRIEVPIELPVSVRERVRTGAPCTLSVDSMPDYRWSGEVVRIAPRASEATRTFELFVEVDNRGQPHQLMPGVFVRAELAGLTLDNVLLVPRAAVQRNRVFVCRDGKAYPRDVHVERHLLDQSVVTGLVPGELVITSNLDALREGTPVQVEEPSGAGAGAGAARLKGELPADQE